MLIIEKIIDFEKQIDSLGFVNEFDELKELKLSNDISIYIGEIYDETTREINVFGEIISTKEKFIDTILKINIYKFLNLKGLEIMFVKDGIDEIKNKNFFNTIIIILDTKYCVNELYDDICLRFYENDIFNAEFQKKIKSKNELLDLYTYMANFINELHGYLKSSSTRIREKFIDLQKKDEAKIVIKRL